ERRQALAPLAAKVPALAKLSEQIDKICNGAGSATASELLNLAAMVDQVRGAQAQAQPLTGELKAIAPTIPIETPLNTNEIVPIYQAISRTGEGRSKVVIEAVDLQLVVDLRLFRHYINSIADPSWDI